MSATASMHAVASPRYGAGTHETATADVSVQFWLSSDHGHSTHYLSADDAEDLAYKLTIAAAQARRLNAPKLGQAA